MNDAQYAGTSPGSRGYQMNAEELQILEKCRSESLMRGSITAVLSGALGYKYIKSFNVKVHPKWGWYPKVGGFAVFGFIIGRLSAIPDCTEKFKKSPTSPFGAYLRQRDLGQQAQSPGFAMESTIPNQTLGFPNSVAPQHASDGPMNSAIDIDVYSSPHNMDSYTGDELNGPEANELLAEQSRLEKPSVSYADLRRRNREDYVNKEREREMNARAGRITIDPPAQPSTRRIPNQPLGPIEEKNKYGDVWG